MAFLFFNNLLICLLSSENSPTIPPDSTVVFSHDEDGRPLLPTVDEQAITGVELKKMLVGYVKAHWGMSY